MTEQITLSVWFFLNSLYTWSCASKTKDMGVLKIYWRVMGCQNCEKVWNLRKFARFCKNHSFQVVASQKKLYWKVGLLLYVKCAWFCSQKHNNECLSSIICDLIGCWSCNKLQKVRNCGSTTHFWSHISSDQFFEIYIHPT